MPITDHLQC